MSWLVTSIANSLNLDDDSTATATSPPPPPSDHQSTTPRGVKDDLSEFSKTLTRQFWGVASFLAPPPQISQDPHPPTNHIDDHDHHDSNEGDLTAITGIRNDLSEIGGRFRTGISKLSSNKAVSEFTKIASNLLQFGSEEVLSVEEYTQRGVVGVTDEVVAFARDVSLHPQTWIDFPLPDDDDDIEDFDLSDAQQEHALAVERLAPELAALRTELCLGYMNEGSFWKIYFVLVHPRLSKQAADILSTSPILRAREMLTQELHTHSRSNSYNSKNENSSSNATELSNEEHLSVPIAKQVEYIPVEISSLEPTQSEVDKHAVTTTEIPVIDKSVVDEVPKKLINNEGPTPNTDRNNELSNTQMEREIPDTSGNIDHKDEEDVDDWLKEESVEGGSLKGTSYQIENDEDVSFSDLEEDDDAPTSYKKDGNPKSSTKESSDWIQLSSQSTDSSKGLNAKGKVSVHNLENKESNDWLDVEDIDDV